MAKNMTATFLSVLKFLFALTLLFLPSSGEPLWEDVCTQDDVRSLPFCDSKLGIEDRVADYTQRIPIEKQIPMLVNNAAGFDDLHIPKYQWWSEGLHGVSVYIDFSKVKSFYKYFFYLVFLSSSND
jgi:hypothetical protein